MCICHGVLPFDGAAVAATATTTIAATVAVVVDTVNDVMQ